MPPLIDRLSGHARDLEQALSGKRYDLGIVEHFWCAPYLEQISGFCDRTVLDLHNIESVLHARCAQTSGGLVAAGQRRFSVCAQKLERELLPGYSIALAASEADAAMARAISPSAHIEVYPNCIPETPVPQVPEEPVVVFSGNFEYHPNIDAVGFLVAAVWPEVRKQCPELRLRLVGRGDKFIRHLLPSGLDIQVTGPVDDALAEIATARIVVAPLRAGSGTRIKIVEAWAAARPVVATLLAAEGLEYRTGFDLLIANEGSSIAGAIAGLNAEPERRARIGASGRHLFETHYTWQSAWNALDTVIGKTDKAAAVALPYGGVNKHCRYTEDSDANSR